MPPEILAIFYEYLFIPRHDTSNVHNFFTPLNKSTLYFQRVNLYRAPITRNRDAFLKFCNSITESNTSGHSLGVMVEELSVLGTSVRNCSIGTEVRDELLTLKIRLAMPHLTRLKVLNIDASSHSHNATTLILVSQLSLAPSCLVELTLDFDDYAFVALILPLFPHLLDLDITLPMIFPTDTATSTDQSSTIPLLPSRYLFSLTIEANFSSLAICNLIGTTNAIMTQFSGENMEQGLAVLKFVVLIL
jgi:hypothetical protein